MSTSRRWGMVGVAVAATVGTAGAGSASALEPVPTSSAAALHDSVGVVTHHNFGDTPYVQRAQVVAALRGLGVAHVRDALRVTRDPATNARLEGDLAAYAAAGLKLTLVVNQDCADDGGLPVCLGVLKGRLPVAGIEAVEWPHEADRFGGTSWLAPLAAWGRQLYTLMKADPVLRPITVIGPSLAKDASPPLLGDQSAFLDVGNIHPFTGAASPGPADITAELRRISAVSKAKPVVATAAGFSTSPTAVVADQPPADERTAAIYGLRTVLEHYADGIGRTFLYELVDEQADPGRGDSNFGLVRTDFSPKPGYTALRDLLGLVGAGAPRAVTPLRYTVTSEAADLRQVVVQRADGSYLVALWRTASVWDRVARKPLAVTPRTVTLDVPDADSFATGTPMAGTALAAQPAASGRISLPVGADPVVVRVTTPAGDRSAAPGAGPSQTGSRPAAGGVLGTRAARPRLTRLRITRVRGRYRATFTVSARARVGGRLERRTGARQRYRTARKLAYRKVYTGRRTMALGVLRPGRHRLRVDLRDTRGHVRWTSVSFTVKAIRRTR